MPTLSDRLRPSASVRASAFRAPPPGANFHPEKAHANLQTSFMKSNPVFHRSPRLGPRVISSMTEISSIDRGLERMD